MACTTTSIPSRTRRTVVLVGLERQTNDGSNVTICTRTDNMEQMLLYEEFNPVQARTETQRFNRAKNSLSPDGVMVKIPTYEFNGTFWLFGKGVPNVPPVWAYLLRASGWKQTRYVSDTAPTIATSEVTATPSASGGVMATGNYRYSASLVAATASNGESKLSTILNPDADVAVTGPTGSVTIDWSGCAALKIAGAKLRIYRTLAGGGASGVRYFVAEVDANTSPYQYVDTYNDENLADPAPTDDVSKEEVLWVPANEFHDSVTIHSYLDGRKYPATGVRGNLTFTGSYGEPVQVRSAMMGIYNANTKVANPAILSSPGFPPRLMATELTITDDSGTDYTPIVKSIEMDLGARVTRRGDTNAATGLIEYGIWSEFSPRVTLVVEFDRNRDWHGLFQAGEKFKIKYTVSPNGVASSTPGTRLEFIAGEASTGNEHQAQLIEDPSFEDVDDGLRGIRLQFEPGEADSGVATATGTFIKIRQY